MKAAILQKYYKNHNNNIIVIMINYNNYKIL